MEEDIKQNSDEQEEKEYKIEEAEKNFNNKEFMIQAINDNATWVLAYASEKILADKDLMLQAVKKDGQVLYYASKEIRDDKEVVLEAVKNKWLIIKYASKRIRGDKEVALAAITQKTDAAIYLTDEILKDPDIDAVLHKKEE